MIKRIFCTEPAQNLHTVYTEQEQYRLKIAVKTAGGSWILLC